MRKLGCLLGPVLLFTATAMGQNTPRVELFGGYSYLDADINNSSFHLNGAHFSGAENLNRWLGGVLDFSDHAGRLNGVNVNAQSVMYGPLFAYRKNRALTPFAHASFGIVRGSAGYLGISKSDTHFAMALGGGLDIKVTKMIWVRAVQADYLQTRFLNLRQDNIRVSTGLVFRFGGF